MLRPAGDPLVRGLAEGREDALAELYDRFADSLFQVAQILLGSRQDAEDAVQEVFVGLVRVRQRLPEVEDIKAYVFTALRRAAARVAAARKVERPLPPDEMEQVSAPQPQGLATESSVRLERALRSLPPDQREVIALKVDGGLTFAEIAAVLGIRPNTAASRYRYALQKLRLALEG
jgi:RNA polymerase sigma-70 factor (ECF subfamily)